MGERITLSFSIDIDKLSYEINRLHDELSKSLLALSSTKRPKDVLSIKSLKQLESLRKSLSDAEYRVIDLENIIKSYLQYSLSSQQVNNSEVEKSKTSNLDEMYKKIAQLSNSLSKENEVTD